MPHAPRSTNPSAVYARGVPLYTDSTSSLRDHRRVILSPEDASALVRHRNVTRVQTHTAMIGIVKVPRAQAAGRLSDPFFCRRVKQFATSRRERAEGGVVGVIVSIYPEMHGTRDANGAPVRFRVTLDDVGFIDSETGAVFTAVDL